MDLLPGAQPTICYLDRRIDVPTAVVRGIVLAWKAQARTRRPHTGGPVQVDVGAGSLVLDDRVPCSLLAVGTGPWAAVGGTLHCGFGRWQTVEFEVERWDHRSAILGLRPGRRGWRRPSPSAYLDVAVPALEALATRLESLASESTAPALERRARPVVR